MVWTVFSFVFALICILDVATGASVNTQVRQCVSDSLLQIECPADHRVVILSAKYARNNNQGCNTDAQPTCWMKDVTGTLYGKCNLQRSCSLQLQAPTTTRCRAKAGEVFLATTYRCEAFGEGSGRAATLDICQDGTWTGHMAYIMNPGFPLYTNKEGCHCSVLTHRPTEIHIQLPTFEVAQSSAPRSPCSPALLAWSEEGGMEICPETWDDLPLTLPITAQEEVHLQWENPEQVSARLWAMIIVHHNENITVTCRSRERKPPSYFSREWETTTAAKTTSTTKIVTAAPTSPTKAPTSSREASSATTRKGETTTAASTPTSAIVTTTTPTPDSAVKDGAGKDGVAPANLLNHQTSVLAVAYWPYIAGSLAALTTCLVCIIAVVYFCRKYTKEKKKRTTMYRDHEVQNSYDNVLYLGTHQSCRLGRSPSTLSSSRTLAFLSPGNLPGNGSLPPAYTSPTPGTDTPIRYDRQGRVKKTTRPDPSNERSLGLDRSSGAVFSPYATHITMDTTDEPQYAVVKKISSSQKKKSKDSSFSGDDGKLDD